MGVKRFSETKLFKAVTHLKSDTWRTVSKLLEQGENVHSRGDYKESYLHLLCAPCALQKVPWLIPVIYQLVNAGLDVNARDKEGNTPLHICAINDTHHSIANVLVKLGADPCLLNKQDSDCYDLVDEQKIRKVLDYAEPGLWRATIEGDLDRVVSLLESWSSVNIKQDGKRLLTVAEQSGHAKVTVYLTQSRDTSKLVCYTLAGDADKVKDLIKRPTVDVNTRDSSFLREDGQRISWPLLAECVRLGLYDVAKILVKRADVNVLIEPSRDITVPLFIWVLDVVRDVDLLNAVLRKAYVSLVQDKVEFLYKAWRKGCPQEMLNQFLKFGFSLAQRDPDGCTLRDRILEASIPDGFDVMRKNVTFVDDFVVKAAKQEQVETLESLVNDGYPYVNVTDKKGRSTLYWAKKAKHKAIVDMLKVLPRFQRQCHSLLKAIEHDSLSEVREHANERTLMAKDRSGRGMLHRALLLERRAIAKYLLNLYPTTIHINDFYHRTALHYACMMEDPDEMVSGLVAVGADEDAQDLDGRTPYDYKQSRDPDFILRERQDTFVADLYLLDCYLAFLAAIDREDRDRLRDILDGLVGVTVNSLPAKLARRYPSLVFRPLLIVCISQEREDMAVFLVEKGTDYKQQGLIKTAGGEDLISVKEAAYEREMDDLIEAIDRKENEGTDFESSYDDTSTEYTGSNTRMSTSFRHHRQLSVASPTDGGELDPADEPGILTYEDGYDWQDHEQQWNDQPEEEQPENMDSAEQPTRPERPRSASCVLL